MTLLLRDPAAPEECLAAGTVLPLLAWQRIEPLKLLQFWASFCQIFEVTT
jgi:hypothetical protein